MFTSACTICICTIWLSISEVSAVWSMLWLVNSATISLRKEVISSPMLSLFDFTFRSAGS